MWKVFPVFSLILVLFLFSTVIKLKLISSVIIFVTKTKFCQVKKFSPIRYCSIVIAYLYCFISAFLKKIIFTLSFFFFFFFFFLPLLHAFLLRCARTSMSILHRPLSPFFFLKTNFPRFERQYLENQETKIFSKCMR